MNFTFWQRLRWVWSRVLAMPQTEPAAQAARILAVQRNIVLPARFAVTVVVFYYLFYAHWLDQPVAAVPREVVLETLQKFFIFYILVTVAAATLLIMRRFPTTLVKWVVFAVGFLDGLLFAGLTAETGGFESTLFWVFPGLIIINALSIPLATPQIVLNLSLSVFYLSAGVLNARLNDSDLTLPPSVYTRPGSPNFTAEDIRDPGALGAQLKQQADPLSRYLWEQVSEPTRQTVLSLATNSAATNTLQASFMEDLNRIMRGKLLYSPERFSGIKLSTDAKTMLSETNPSTERTIRANRLLLEEAYPQELARGRHARPNQLGFMRYTKPMATSVEAESGSEPFLLRLIILWLLTSSCYGVQLLAFRDREAQREALEAAARNSELKAAGRLAAEIAHQLKNPLGIINNAVFSLERGLKQGKRDFTQQLQIIREEIERSDGIITQLMGYAQLSEGRVEKLSVPNEVDRAIAEVFPRAANYATQIHKEFGPNLPALVMQRIHLSAVLVNLLQNAREALNGRGNITISAQPHGGNGVEIVIADDGPGVAPDKLGRVFDAYFTSKARGTGLGLPIVKHNVELYGGTVNVESKLGKGARFILLFPSRTFVT
jgi:signal transduction histidine kinase